MYSLIVIILLSYLVGSFPTSIVVGRMLRRIDIREHGSANAGGTNVFRVLGWKPGLFVAAVDIGKGILATLVVSRIRIDPIPLPLEVVHVQLIAGVCAVIGHIWTVLAKFKGGKGVATGAGLIIALFPWAALICFFVFVTLVLTTRYVSLGSLVATLCFPLALLVLDRMLGQSVPSSLYIFSICVSGLIFYTHRSNIRRLINGTENRFDKIHFRKRY
ncbi:glycerol-3-phosphate 1-O-acyltransferase PlsY [candidate division KSB1 bacterium]|nr:glycerol-3-phosphate 1-O-acyltransferase PlsY [candidate division KSB1 bacterium]NIR72001.1 glycerol-3-phosphate 1-O-acyltransferase PlsY [candidate division KSB1 bacterium]NIS24994.1 glycerol-3-phosphate 1-O-acyltransferase PlsY [candidate division KSB1 bacterium]NIT71910.1 glycerol-3-phosphate 1-O-acyltransferase PlsY [candidate division KSB1 bacterium]NIU25649.1 glycerol-3-phosphate 1-O-acyltransferase PlsY [candidate division KSB1 bacterium]